jgi:N5-methyltetrahydromethanopterin:coenzyme M methyltransferase subunit G
MVDDEVRKLPVTVAPADEFRALIDKLNLIDERIEFVLGEVSQREGLKIGMHVGFIYGILSGFIITIILKYLLRLI